MSDGPGLTLARFLDSIADEGVRRLLDKRLLSVVDAVSGGRILGPNLRRLALTLVDLDVMLGNNATRGLILNLLPDHKRVELEARVGRSIRPFSDWTDPQAKQLRGFFGLTDDTDLLPARPLRGSVTPEYALFDHQRGAVRRLVPLLSQDERRAILHLPTGVGKTRTAMHVVAEWFRTHEPSIVVWLASGRELLEQAAGAFKEAWGSLGTRPLQLETVWGDDLPALDRLSDGFLVAGLTKAWVMTSRTDPDWAARLAPRVRLVVFDEAHQSTAPTYRRITEELTLDFRCAVLGLTATPGRSWSDIDKDGELANYFSGNKVTLDVPSANPIDYLIDKGFLAKPTFRTLFSEAGIRLNDRERSRISTALEIPSDIIDLLSLSEQYVTAVIAAVDKLLHDGHTRVLVFAATVDHARLLAGILAGRNVRSAVVTALTSGHQRARAVHSFRSENSEPMVLVNFGVLTTGFDAPNASAVVIARPTQSLVLYSQMVGRAIRGPRVGGTRTCEVVTVIDPSLPGFGDVAAAFLHWEDVW